MSAENTLDTDAALAARIASARPARDLEAEDLLFRRLAPRARLYGRRHLRDAQAANDLAQDALLLTLQRLRDGSIRQPEQIASFVLGACRQMIVDRRRTARRRDERLQVFAADLQPGDIEVPEVLHLEHLQRCLEALLERERSVVLMTFYDERSADQIALDLGVSPVNVRVIRHRGLERLRHCLRKHEDRR